MRQIVIVAIRKHLRNMVELGYIESSEEKEILSNLNKNSSKGASPGLQLVNKKDVARMLCCSRKTIERRVAEGTLTPIRIKDGRLVQTTKGKRRVGAVIKFEIQDVEKFICERRDKSKLV